MSEPSTAQTAPPTNTRPITKAGAIRFVLTFLVLTVAFLTAGRYAVNTTPMNWYLFQVARQTAAVLGLLGDASHVEDIDSYKSRTATMRAEMEAWRAGRELTPGRQGPSEPPISAYEVWTYRALRLARDLKLEQRALAMTAPVPTFAAPVAIRIDVLEKVLDRLDKSGMRGDSSGSALVMARGLPELLANTRATIKALTLNPPPPDLEATALDKLEAQIERGRLAQRAFIENRVEGLTSQIQDRLGPLVTFSARETPPPPKRFSFHLVPDCGALPSMSIYLAALLAFPAGARKRIAGLLVGVPILYAINIVRLTCLALIGAWAQNTEIFEFAHQYVWQAVYILIVVGVWLMWVEYIVRPGEIWRKTPTSAG